jgi:hypothetical protein
MAGIGVAVLAIAAVAVSRGRSSFVVAGLLAASGSVGVVHALIRRDFLMASTFPGPIFGIILRLPILGLAVAEAVGATRARSSTRSRGEARYRSTMPGWHVDLLGWLVGVTGLEPVTSSL